MRWKDTVTGKADPMFCVLDFAIMSWVNGDCTIEGHQCLSNVFYCLLKDLKVKPKQL